MAETGPADGVVGLLYDDDGYVEAPGNPLGPAMSSRARVKVSLVRNTPQLSIIVVCISAITTLGTNANATFQTVGAQVGGVGS